MEEAPLILLFFHLPIPLRYPSFHAIYPNTLSRFPSNKIPVLPGPTQASVELCEGLAQIKLISPCSNLQGPRKAARALPAPARPGRDEVPHPSIPY